MATTNLTTKSPYLGRHSDTLYIEIKILFIWIFYVPTDYNIECGSDCNVLS